MSRGDKIAEERDNLTSKLSDTQVWSRVIGNILTLRENAVDTIEILFEAIPDLAVILSNITLYKSKGLIDMTTYNDLMTECLLKLNRLKRTVTYNPLRYTD
ncbi:MAG: hypothetical protein IH840_06060 [Candidatus Heimdallarchaeota archaeon]|nr:hypothetical protein [Candidatus Heimdallarchaeota archaeon]